MKIKFRAEQVGFPVGRKLFLLVSAFLEMEV